MFGPPQPPRTRMCDSSNKTCTKTAVTDTSQTVS